jgi:hypothetical protein
VRSLFLSFEFFFGDFTFEFVLGGMN